MLSQQETNIEEKKNIFKICILLSDVYKKKTKNIQASFMSNAYLVLSLNKTFRLNDGALHHSLPSIHSNNRQTVTKTISCLFSILSCLCGFRAEYIFSKLLSVVYHLTFSYSSSCISNLKNLS